MFFPTKVINHFSKFYSQTSHVNIRLKILILVYSPAPRQVHT